MKNEELRGEKLRQIVKFVKAAIKREQSHACMSYVEREQARILSKLSNVKCRAFALGMVKLK